MDKLSKLLDRIKNYEACDDLKKDVSSLNDIVAAKIYGGTNPIDTGCTNNSCNNGLCNGLGAKTNSQCYNTGCTTSGQTNTSCENSGCNNGS